MKKIRAFFLVFLLFICLLSCAQSNADSLKLGYSQKPYFNIKESHRQLSDKRITTGITGIPSLQYESYPAMQSIPLTATLYKDGAVMEIDTSDPRLMQLVNFFNNALYYEKCAYLLSYLSPEHLSQVEEEPFRLELTYTPYGETNFGPYEANTTLCDTMIITNSNDGGFYLINHNLQAYDGEYPVLAAGYVPLFHTYPWLDFFGF